MYDLLIKGWWKTSETHNLIVWPNIPPFVLNFQDECDAMTSEKQPEKLKQLILLLQDLFSDLNDTIVTFADGCSWSCVAKRSMRRESRTIGGDNSNIFSIFIPKFGGNDPICRSYLSDGLKLNHQRENKYWPDWIDGRWLELCLLETGKVSCTVLPVHCQARTKRTDALSLWSRQISQCGFYIIHSFTMEPCSRGWQVDDTYPLSMSINAHMKRSMTRCPRAFKRKLGSPKHHQTKTQTGSDCLQQFHLVFLYVVFDKSCHDRYFSGGASMSPSEQQKAPPERTSHRFTDATCGDASMHRRCVIVAHLCIWKSIQKWNLSPTELEKKRVSFRAFVF